MSTAVALIKIKVASDFSTTPGPRSPKEGGFSGYLFRTNVLAPAVKRAISEDADIEINLDGTAGYGTSFLEESFGGLIRDEHLSYDDIVTRLTIISNEEEYLKDDILEYLKDAADANS